MITGVCGFEMQPVAGFEVQGLGDPMDDPLWSSAPGEGRSAEPGSRGGVPMYNPETEGVMGGEEVRSSSTEGISCSSSGTSAQKSRTKGLTAARAWSTHSLHWDLEMAKGALKRSGSIS